jgi:ribosome-binding factor A
MHKSSFRDKRVAELLKEEISAIIFSEVKDPRVKNVSITEVVVSKDLSVAKVYFRTLIKEDSEDSLNGLNKSAGFIKSRLVKNIRLKHIPTLEFFYDDTLDNVIKIETLIKEISSKK